MFAKIELRAEQSIKDIDTFEQYSAVVVGFKNYSELNGIDKSLPFLLIFIDIRIPLIIANTYGRYGVSYCHVGENFEFKEKLLLDQKEQVGFKSNWFRSKIQNSLTPVPFLCSCRIF